MAQLPSRRVRAIVATGQIVLDLIAVSGSYLGANALLTAYEHRHEAYGLRHEDLVIVFLILPIFMAANFYTRAYATPALQSFHVAATRMMHSWLVTLAMVLAIVFASKAGPDFSRAVFIEGSVASMILLLVTRWGMIHLVRTRLAEQFSCSLLIDSVGVACVSNNIVRVDPVRIGLRPDLFDPIGLHNFSGIASRYDKVIVACPAEQRLDWSIYLQAVGCVGEIVIPEIEGLPMVHHANRDQLPTVQVSLGALDLPDRVLKRVLDLSITVPLIIGLSPLLLIVAILVKLSSPGPILFRQQRMGRGNRLFDVYKFRSMRHEMSDSSGDRSASRDDDRITPLGRIIRSTSIDELPQLFNVLQGDMALVGPRPHALGSRAGSDLFWQIDQRYWLRHAIKPGITGLAQVRGFRGATDHEDDLRNRLLSDLEYLSDWSIFRDLMILMRTVGVVLHKNAF